MFDGGFFGLGLGFASFAAIIPLFVSHLTDSAPVTILAPVIGGWLADAVSFNATFMISAICGVRDASKQNVTLVVSLPQSKMLP
jgi:hypothetical protein